MRKVITLFAILTLFGCATYQQPSLPSNQTSLLSFEQKDGGIFSAGSVALSKIDGVAPSASSTIFRHRSSLRITSGKHILDLNYVMGTYTGDASLWFVAEPGINYIVKGESKGYEFILWVEECRTGKRVGGIKGSADEPM